MNIDEVEKRPKKGPRRGLTADEKRARQEEREASGARYATVAAEGFERTIIALLTDCLCTLLPPDRLPYRSTRFLWQMPTQADVFVTKMSGRFGDLERMRVRRGEKGFIDEIRETEEA